MHRPTQSMHVAYGLTLAGAMLMVGGVSLLRVRGWTTPLQGRKIMHLLTGREMGTNAHAEQTEKGLV